VILVKAMLVVCMVGKTPPCAHLPLTSPYITIDECFSGGARAAVELQWGLEEANDPVNFSIGLFCGAVELGGEDG
jgi:hypothetical protein